MTHDYPEDKLREALQLCAIHNERMQYAYHKVMHYFPITSTSYKALSNDDLSYLDQLIFRFSKLQDSMGNHLFPALLENLGWGDNRNGALIRNGRTCELFCQNLEQMRKCAKAAQINRLPEKIMITNHSQHWINRLLPWLKKLVY
jgi:hypothetical protein